MLALRWPAVE